MDFKIKWMDHPKMHSTAILWRISTHVLSAYGQWPVLACVHGLTLNFDVTYAYVGGFFFFFFIGIKNDKITQRKKHQGNTLFRE
jgi:hypothetical protein